MKQKILLILTIFTMGTLMANGQTAERKKHDTSVVYGFSPFTFHDIWDDTHSIGIFSVQYLYNPAKWLGIGVMIGLQHFEANKSWSYSGNDYTAMFLLRANWINKPNFMLYSKAGIGSTIQHENNSLNENNNDNAAALQISLIGTNFSLGKDFFGMAELGIGSQGLLMLGAGYKF